MPSRKTRKNKSGGVVYVAGLVVLLGALAAVYSGRLGSALSGGTEVASRPPPKEPTTVDVFVAVQDIDEGFELKRTMFRQETREKKEVAQAALVQRWGQLRGTYAKAFIPNGQLLVSEFVTDQPPVNSVVPKIRTGYRAITIQLDKPTTNEGWARAGVRADVVLFTAEKFDSKAVVIAQNVTVLSSGTSVSSEFGGDAMEVKKGVSTVTLEVTVEDQKRIKLAAGKGDLRLLLRGDDDTEIHKQAPFRVDVRSVVIPPGGNREIRPSDQGWFMVDGRRYRVMGASLLPE